MTIVRTRRRSAFVSLVVAAVLVGCGPKEQASPPASTQLAMPSAAPMLSPVPAEIAAPQEVRPTISAGPAIRGSATGCPSARDA